MEFAYDHIQEEIVAQDTSNDKGKDPEKPKESLNEEFQEAYKAFSASPWGVRVGSFIGTVKKQGESYYETGKKEAAVRAEQASKGFNVVRSEIVNRTRSLSITHGGAPPLPPLSGPLDGQQTGETSKDGAVAGEKSQQEEGLLSKLKKGAAQRISEMEAAEARADEYLLRFGANIGNFLKEAVTIRPPEGSEGGLGGDKKELVFEQKGEEGKRQIYSTRLDAQLHLLHGNLELFKTDSNETSFLEWSRDFSANGRTEQIAADLDKYPDLRNTMEKLVPDFVQYTDFWRRYYFLRNELDMEEQKRKELLKGATTLDEEEVGWDEDDEDESDVEKPKPTLEPIVIIPATTTTAPATLATSKEDISKLKSSIDRASQPDSESSYDVVSGVPSKAPSQATSSPTVAKAANESGDEEESSDEEKDDDDDDDEEEEEDEDEDEDKDEDEGDGGDEEKKVKEGKENEEEEEGSDWE